MSKPFFNGLVHRILTFKRIASESRRGSNFFNHSITNDRFNPREEEGADTIGKESCVKGENEIRFHPPQSKGRCLNASLLRSASSFVAIGVSFESEKGVFLDHFFLGRGIGVSVMFVFLRKTPFKFFVVLGGFGMIDQVIPK